LNVAAVGATRCRAAHKIGMCVDCELGERRAFNGVQKDSEGWRSRGELGVG
jgi:hypothetical protein